ncbi:hypothetical protein, partial [Endozoicomonas acroporae]
DDGEPGELPGGGNGGDGSGDSDNNDEGLLEQIEQFAKGLWDGLKEQISGLWELVRHPIESAKNIYNLAKGFVLDPDGTIELIIEELGEDIRDLL